MKFTSYTHILIADIPYFSVPSLLFVYISLYPTLWAAIQNNKNRNGYATLELKYKTD